MNRILKQIGIAIAVTLGVCGMLLADDTNSCPTNITYRMNAPDYSKGMALNVSGFGYLFCGQDDIVTNMANTAPLAGYCVDMTSYITPGVNYDGLFVPLADAAKEDAVAYLVHNYEASNSLWGAALQVAIWKIVFTNSPVVVSPPVESLANNLVAEATGKRPLRGTGTVSFQMTGAFAGWQTNGMWKASIVVTLKEDGLPVIGESISLTATAGTFQTPINGVGRTDANGKMVAMIVNIAGNSVSVEAYAAGESINLIQSCESQDFVVKGNKTYFEVDPPLSPDYLGDPRNLAYWKHQVKLAATGSKKAEIDAATFNSLLPVAAFDATVVTLDGLDSALGDASGARNEAIAQGLALKLNMAYGEVGPEAVVNIKKGHLGAVTVNQAIEAAESAYDSDDYKTAKEICAEVNAL